MADNIPATKQALDEAKDLAEEIIKNIELGEISLERCALKTVRLARLRNDFSSEEMFRLEVDGYSKHAGGISPEDWARALRARRDFSREDPKTKEISTLIFVESIGALESTIETQKLALESARDGNVSITSANPHQFVRANSGNVYERNNIKKSIGIATTRLSSRRSLIYDFAMSQYYELKFSGIVDDLFSRIRERVDRNIGEIIPSSVKRFSAIYDNMRSDNPEDLSNAVHSCRRILQDLADILFPATEDKVVEANGKQRRVKLGPDNYINRLVAYVEQNSDSERFEEIVGSHISFLGERLDSVFKAAQKGSHATIINKSEADRYITYTYMLVGDLLSIRQV
jgi:hypothetical protein